MWIDFFALNQNILTDLELLKNTVKRTLLDGLAELHKEENQLKEEDTKEKEREKEKADEDSELHVKLIQDATNGLKDKVVNKGMVSLSNDCPNVKVL